jgi:hypothetical protein
MERDAKSVADSVQEVVKECSIVNVDRTCISGSFGKRTALPDFDIDLVLFLNDSNPPFESEIECLCDYHIAKEVNERGACNSIVA